MSILKNPLRREKRGQSVMGGVRLTYRHLLIKIRAITRNGQVLQYGTTCTRIRTNRTFSVNQSDTTAVTLWQNSSCTTHNQNIDSIAYSSGGSITADAYVIDADGNKNCAVAINDTDTDTWTLVDE
jgi:hypothetical protein